MNRPRQIPWPRIFAESVVIVTSILLAFAIDAWWQRKSEFDQAEALEASLLDDFRASQAHLERWLAGNRRAHAAVQKFLDLLRGRDIGQRIDVPTAWLMAALGTPTYSPTDATLRAAVSSGHVELLRNPQLRKLLAAWGQQLEDTHEDELLVRHIVVDRLAPLLAEQSRLGPVFEFDEHIGWFTTGTEADPDRRFNVEVTAPLEGALAERHFYGTFVVRGLAGIERTQAEIIHLLEAHIEARKP